MNEKEKIFSQYEDWHRIKDQVKNRILKDLSLTEFFPEGSIEEIFKKNFTRKRRCGFKRRIKKEESPRSYIFLSVIFIEIKKNLVAKLPKYHYYKYKYDDKIFLQESYDLNDGN